jgi:hypothetical protein
MTPTNRVEFGQFIIRQLGSPVIEINLSEQQVDDCIDKAIYFFNEWHYNGYIKTYYAHQVLDADIASKSFQMPANTIGAVRIFPLGIAMSSNNLFNLRYQFIMNDLYSMTNVSLIPYYMVMGHLAQLEEVLVGQQPLRYNRHENILHVDMDWTTVCAGSFIVVEAYTAIDGTSSPDMWRDRWLQDYAVALTGQAWGRVLSKYDVVLPSGMKTNGMKILDDYTADVKRMEREVPMQPLAVFMA